MKKFIKITLMLAAVLAVPALAGAGITALWNAIIPTVCGFAAITFPQGVGLFMLGQLLCGGFLVMLFAVIGGIHSIGHNSGDWHDHWHKMSDRERREFILRRRSRFGFRNNPQTDGDAAE